MGTFLISDTELSSVWGAALCRKQYPPLPYRRQHFKLEYPTAATWILDVIEAFMNFGILKFSPFSSSVFLRWEVALKITFPVIYTNLNMFTQCDSKLLSGFPWSINGNPDSNLEYVILHVLQLQPVHCFVGYTPESSKHLFCLISDRHIIRYLDHFMCCVATYSKK
jgi:hypothetical protein